jgi:hypothetical protein
MGRFGCQDLGNTGKSPAFLGFDPQKPDLPYKKVRSLNQGENERKTSLIIFVTPASGNRIGPKPVPTQLLFGRCAEDVNLGLATTDLSPSPQKPA